LREFFAALGPQSTNEQEEAEGAEKQFSKQLSAFSAASCSKIPIWPSIIWKFGTLKIRVKITIVYRFVIQSA
jgi:hypothetical protein